MNLFNNKVQREHNYSDVGDNTRTYKQTEYNVSNFPQTSEPMTTTQWE